jgi:antitoxin component YwqK of YwqJK toxin-antitoxin module
MRRKHYAISFLVFLAMALALAIRIGRTPPAQDQSEVQRSELDLRNGVLYRRASSKPFTGSLVEDYAKGERKLQIEIRAGKVDGLSHGWFAPDDGQVKAEVAEMKGPRARLEVEEHFVAGVSHGLRTRWHLNGQKKSEERIEQGVVTGAYVEWHDNGQKAVEMRFQGGHPEGLAQAWYPDGSLKSETRFSTGKIVDRKFFPASLAAAATGSSTR